MCILSSHHRIAEQIVLFKYLIYYYNEELKKPGARYMIIQYSYIIILYCRCEHCNNHESVFNHKTKNIFFFRFRFQIPIFVFYCTEFAYWCLNSSI